MTGRHDPIDVQKAIELRDLGYSWREITEVIRRKDGSKFQVESIEQKVRKSGLPYRKGVFVGVRGLKSGGHQGNPD